MRLNIKMQYRLAERKPIMQYCIFYIWKRSPGVFVKILWHAVKTHKRQFIEWLFQASSDSSS